MRIHFKNISFSLVTLLTVVVGALCFAACSETDNTIEEFPNWQSKNDTYWTNLYNATKAKVDAGDTSWRLILNYSKEKQTTPTTSSITYKPEDYIIVHIEDAGGGTGSPLFTDSVRVHYQGRLIPSTTYTNGLIFDTSWSDEKFNASTSRAAHLLLSGTVDGFATALQKMTIGDHWTVYMPYKLAYDGSANGLVPAYSNLIFDLRLVEFGHPGTPLGNN